MPRGGRRAGAGAPKGNINAIKHGRYSNNAKALVNSLATQVIKSGVLHNANNQPEPPPEIQDD